MTEFEDVQLQRADDEGFVDRRPSVEVSKKPLSEDLEFQLQLDVAEWEGMGLRKVSDEGREAKFSDSDAFKILFEGEHAVPSGWDTDSAIILKPEVSERLDQ